MEYPKDLRREFPKVFDRAYEQMRKFRLVRDIMTSKVITITEDKTMGDAAKVMGEKHIGSLIVVADAKPKGIVTERDLLSGILALGRDPAKTKVGTAMSWPLVTISPDAPIKDAARIMMKRKGRLAVMEKEKLIGIVSASDFIRSLPDVPETVVKVEDYMTTEVVIVDEEKSVADIAVIMGKERIGSVIVASGGKPKGIFTERDLLTTFLKEGKSLAVAVKEYTSTPLIVAPAWISIYEAAYIMADKHIRRLPLVEEEELIGIITARDLVEAYAK
ncbi:MAG: CBS domain-containing protein [Candidatus Bathyarchaeota archaeon]|nr:CBS domain-containing protein [Candidatus Bathyarchaeota archaeon]